MNRFRKLNHKISSDLVSLGIENLEDLKLLGPMRTFALLRKIFPDTEDRVLSLIFEEIYGKKPQKNEELKLLEEAKNKTSEGRKIIFKRLKKI